MFSRIYAVLLRHLYLYPRSLSRVMEIFYWPVLDLLVWGFLTLYLMRHPGALSEWKAFLLGALILWDILFRAQQAISVSFLEEIWSRNLLNLFASPLSAFEFIGATMILSFFKFILAGAVTVVLAWFFYDFNIFRLGFWFIPLVFNLVVMAWTIGIVTTGIILLYGEKAEALAWGIVLFVQPFGAVFYPVSVLPKSLQYIAHAMPCSYVFEAMRDIFTRGTTDALTFAVPFLLNALYLWAALRFFKFMFRQAQIRGLLTKLGE